MDRILVFAFYYLSIMYTCLKLLQYSYFEQHGSMFHMLHDVELYSMFR